MTPVVQAPSLRRNPEGPARGHQAVAEIVVVPVSQALVERTYRRERRAAVGGIAGTHVVRRSCQARVAKREVERHHPRDRRCARVGHVARLHGGDVGRVEPGQHRVGPPRQNLDVLVHLHDEVTRRRGETEVERRRRATPRTVQHPDIVRRREQIDDRQRFVGAAIIDHDDLGAGKLLEQRRERARQPRRAVSDGHHEADAFRHLSSWR